MGTILLVKVDFSVNLREFVSWGFRTGRVLVSSFVAKQQTRKPPLRHDAHSGYPLIYDTIGGAMILIKFAFALLTLLPISSAAPAERTELSVVAGDTPRSVRITGPKSLTDLGKRKYGKWVGCSYSIQWGDGSESPAGPIGADYGQGLSHTYRDTGTYRIVAKTFHPAPDDSHIDDWVGEAKFVAK